MRRSRGTGRVIGAISVGVLALAGCSSSGGSNGSGFSVADALDQVPPATVDEDVLIFTGDLLRASEIAGIERPEDLDDATQWLVDLTLGNPSADVDVPIFVPVGEMSSAGARFGGVEEFEDELGWSLLDIDSFVEVSQPPVMLAVVDGEFDQETLEDLEDLGDGVFSYGTGEDFAQDIANRNPVDQFGRPVRFAERDGRLAMSTSTPAVEQWLDGDGGSSLEDLRAIADALDDADVYSAVLHSPESGFGLDNVLGQISPEAVEQIEERDWLPSELFHSVGVGWSVVDGEAVITFVFAHEDAEDADTNAEHFEAMFIEGLSITRWTPIGELYDLEQVTTDGNLVIVTVNPTEETPVAVPFSALTSRDTPFVHR